MKIVVISTLAALSMAAPQYSSTSPVPTQPSTTPALYGVQGVRSENPEAPAPIAILRNDRVQNEDGTFNFEFEGDNGIIVSGSGSPSGENGTVVQTGNYKYTSPDGTVVELTYVADEKGFQPQSDSLPVAPEFPHPIPQFVLDQIAKAEEEDKVATARDSVAGAGAPSSSNVYAAPA
ncbi:cuticle protein AM1274-like [Macrobrachium rosenbergii]|uniref:cuticle protein AM1274-like n=1 Tax=Macrobrachium rosenbergii TaxID=79674 RepID=UPI0034D55CD0